jgi:transposase-like protein
MLPHGVVSPGRPAARPASTIKPPDRCPYCNSPRLIKKGARRKKLEHVPLLRCRSCGRTFAPGPPAVRNKTYPINEILEAVTLYDRGNTLEETAAKISSRHGHAVAPSTISRWLSGHPSLTTYRRFRDHGRRLFTPTQVIRVPSREARVPPRRLARREAGRYAVLHRALRGPRRLP